MEKPNKKLQYNSLLKLLFDSVLPGTGLYAKRQPEPNDFNRVRRMCKSFGVEVMQASIEQFQECLDWDNPPKLETITQALDYLYGIARKTVINSPESSMKIDIEGVIKSL